MGSQVIDDVHKPGRRPGPLDAAGCRRQRRRQWRQNLLPRCRRYASRNFGTAGRYAHYRYEVEILAFVLDRLKATNA
ncbi:hypothetical protein ACN26Y_24655 [Micromonospora sp. WMMD558]|uniref:hypothetical protein n=1 Tax=unclassified Micromonospora TaxID=2617518 RepID=UPI001E4DA12C|nr:hypothetical protein [Micromonospora sp. WMMC415]